MNKKKREKKMSRENIIHCDYCGKRIYSTTDYILPVVETRTEYAFKNNCKLAKVDIPEINPRRRDICGTCVNKIARLTNLMKYVEIDVDAMENNIYETLMKMSTKGIPEP